jgi:hypothetical protein
VLVTAPNSSEGTEQPTTSNLTFAEIALSDPLKAETRNARLYLLGVSMVSITIVYTGLVPQELTTLGLTFGEADRQSLLVILTLVILYFLGSFAIYGLSDFLSWRYAYLRADWLREIDEMSESILEVRMKTEAALEAAEDDTGDRLPRGRLIMTLPALPPALARPVSWGRALLDFLLPLLVALYATYALLSA